MLLIYSASELWVWIGGFIIFIHSERFSDWKLYLYGEKEDLIAEEGIWCALRHTLRSWKRERCKVDGGWGRVGGGWRTIHSGPPPPPCNRIIILHFNSADTVVYIQFFYNVKASKIMWILLCWFALHQHCQRFVIPSTKQQIQNLEAEVIFFFINVKRRRYDGNWLTPSFILKWKIQKSLDFWTVWCNSTSEALSISWSCLDYLSAKEHTSEALSEEYQ